MKKILITQRLDLISSYGEVRAQVDIRWMKFLYTSGYLPVVVNYDIPFDEWVQAVGSFHGVVFTGGNNITSSPEHNELDIKRDNLERMIMSYVLNSELPVIGVCRGAQFITSYFGGGIGKCTNHVGTEHAISFNTDSRIGKHFHKTEMVNSYHDYCINSAGDLLIAAECIDGGIEAVEHKDKEIYGIMWHPERCDQFNKVDLDFFKSVFR